MHSTHQTHSIQNIWISKDRDEYVKFLSKSTVKFLENIVYHVVMYIPITKESINQNEDSLCDDIRIMRMTDFTNQYKPMEQEPEYKIIIWDGVNISPQEFYYTIDEIDELNTRLICPLKAELIECSERIRHF